MNASTLDLLRCPYCGGTLDVVESTRRDGDEIHDAILGCHCCVFPLVAGIPVLHLDPPVPAARDHIGRGRLELALQAMVGLQAAAQTAAFQAAAASEACTYKQIVEALGPTLEGSYFLYRFSDPTYVVANAVARAVARVVLHGNRRAVDLCGGSGHLMRSLITLSSARPVLADRSFVKIWLARRFVAVGCEGVCCDANAPLPFARAAFGLAMCCDALQYVWTKRQFVAEMTRLVDGGGEPGALVINHAHNALTRSPSLGQPLAPAGYRELFETIEPRIFGDAALLEDVVAGRRLDLSRVEPEAALDAQPALTIVATRHRGVFDHHPIDPGTAAGGEFRINPLYEVERDGALLRLRLRFPSVDYEEEYAACRSYLPSEASVEAEALAALNAGRSSAALDELVRRRVIVDVPPRYY